MDLYLMADGAMANLTKSARRRTRRATKALRWFDENCAIRCGVT